MQGMGIAVGLRFLYLAHALNALFFVNSDI